MNVREKIMAAAAECGEVVVDNHDVATVTTPDGVAWCFTVPQRELGVGDVVTLTSLVPGFYDWVREADVQPGDDVMKLEPEDITAPEDYEYDDGTPDPDEDKADLVPVFVARQGDRGVITAVTPNGQATVRWTRTGKSCEVHENYLEWAGERDAGALG